MRYYKIHRLIAGAHRGLVDKMTSTLMKLHFRKNHSANLHGLLELTPMTKCTVRICHAIIMT